MNLTILYKLFRFKPTIAWSMCGSLLGLSIAIHEYGYDLNWFLVGLAISVAMLLQAFLSHAINDITDEQVDKLTDLKGTGRYKVLVSGIATHYDLYLIAGLVLLYTVFVTQFIYIVLGWKVLIFAAIGLYAPLAYSLEPLKLGWKPFSEWTITLPVLIATVVGINFVATGQSSHLANIASVIFALFNIIWFLISRMMDYEPDKEVGKITTFVHYSISHNKQGVNYYLVAVNWVLILFSLWATLFISFIFVVSFFLAILYDTILPNEILKTNETYSNCRTAGIYLSIINSIILSIAFILL